MVFLFISVNGVIRREADTSLPDSITRRLTTFKLKAQVVLRANLDKLEPYLRSLLAQVDFK